MRKMQKISDALEQNPADFGSLLKSIPTDNVNLELSDLIVSKALIFKQLTSLNIKITPDEISPQPSALGLALIANYYNTKDLSQHCNIYVASTLNDFQNIAVAIGAKNGNKAAVIFQPSDTEQSEWAGYFFAMHKIVVYLEMREDVLHILMADSTPYENCKKVCTIIADRALPHVKQIYYMQKPMILDIEKNTPTHIQTDFCSCGTHAMRLARIITKNSNFLETLNCVPLEPTLEASPHRQYLLFEMPVEFSKCADNKIARDKCALVFSSNFEKIADGFARHNKGELAYINKFTSKYLAIIATTFVEVDSTELLAMIQTVDAKNYKPTKCKVTANIMV